MLTIVSIQKLHLEMAGLPESYIINLLHELQHGFIIFWQDNAQKIAEFLSSHPRVKKVNYAGLKGHPGRELHYSQVLPQDRNSHY